MRGLGQREVTGISMKPLKAGGIALVSRPPLVRGRRRGAGRLWLKAKRSIRPRPARRASILGAGRDERRAGRDR